MLTAADVSALALPREHAVGDVTFWTLTDGTFRPEPGYLGPDAAAPGNRELFGPAGPLAVLPVGCFLLRVPGRKPILVDAGQGPHTLTCTSTGGGQDTAVYGMLEGGLLPAQFARIGVDPAEVGDVILTHLHSDHLGWLVEPGRDLFPAARIWASQTDYEYFQHGVHASGLLDGLSDRERSMCLGQLDRFAELNAQGRVSLIEDTPIEIAPGVATRPAPGHTPGHLAVQVTTGDERLLLLADAMTCPQQLHHPGWHSIGDVDVAVAARMREDLWRELARPETRGVGSHFPQARDGRVSHTEGGARAQWIER